MHSLLYTRRNLGNLSDDDGFGVREKPATEIPALANLQAMQTVAAKESQVFYIGAIFENTPGFDNAFAIRVENDGSTFDLTKDLSKRVNFDPNKDMWAVENDQMSLSEIYTFTVGNASPAALDENTKDTMWFRYINGTDGQARMVLINTEPEEFSGDDPTSEFTQNWTRAWFKK